MQIGEEGSRRVPNGCRKILARDQDRTREGEELLFKWEWMAEIRIRIDDFWTRACASSGSSKGREIFKFPDRVFGRDRKCRFCGS